MNIGNKFLVALTMLLTTSFTAKTSYAQSVVGGVEFGTVLSGGGDCVGKGVCDCTVYGSGNTKVKFSVSADGTSLIMQFSMTELASNQPDQAQNFSTGSYVFDGTYVLSNDIFSSLNLPTGANINPNSNGTVSIDGDVVTVYETIYSQN